MMASSLLAGWRSGRPDFIVLSACRPARQPEVRRHVGHVTVPDNPRVARRAGSPRLVD